VGNLGLLCGVVQEGGEGRREGRRREEGEKAGIRKIFDFLQAMHENHGKNDSPE
jgi:hypothetical protein